MEERWPWEAEESLEPSDPLAHQRLEESFREQLPRVVKLLPVQGTVMGSSSPHQTGDIVCYDILKRAPLYDLTSHFSDIHPHAPVRGAHRHISAPTLFCLSGRGWEVNDGKTYWFSTYDMASQGRWVSRNDVWYLVDLKGKRMQIPSLDWDDKQVELIKLYNSIFTL